MDDAEARAARPHISGFERSGAWIVFAVWLAMRVIGAFRYRIDSDETQHLHVVWGWTRGLMPYRDVFDNHAPLFQMLMAPLLWILPESPETILWMRLAVIPMHAACLWAVYLIGGSVFTRRTGFYAALIAAFVPSYFLCSTEFRTDDLWNVFWLFGLAALFNRPSTRRAAFWAGLLFGGALATSLKTTLLLACLAGASALCASFALATRTPIEWKRGLRLFGAGAGGFAILPCAVIAYFAARHNLDGLYYGTIRHNVLGSSHFAPATRRFLKWAVVIGVAAWFCYRFGAKDRRAVRTVLFFTAAIYLDALFTLWPLLEREHFLPFFPLASLLVAAFLLRGARREQKAPVSARLATWSRFTPWAAVAAITLLVGFEWKALYDDAQLGTDQTGPARELIRETLAVTDPDESVVDLKGETVFRRRANFYAEEPLTRRMESRGELPDDTVERAVAQRAVVARNDSRSFTDRSRAFLDANYLPAGEIRVAGKVLHRGKLPAGEALAFSIPIPADYAFVSRGRKVNGTLDGMPVSQSAHLTAGAHQFASAATTADLRVVLARALQAHLVIGWPMERPQSKQSPSAFDARLHKLLF